MAKMTLLWCLIRIQGDMNQVTPPSDRGFGPCIISWPEAQVLAVIHNADDALEQVRVVGTAETTPRAEKARLNALYGDKVVEQLFPGVSPRMELEAPADFTLSASEPEAPLTDAGPVPVPSFVITDAALLADANKTSEFPPDFFAGEDEGEQAPEDGTEPATEVPSPRNTRTRRAV